MGTSDKIALAALVASVIAIVISIVAATYARRQAIAAEEANRLNARPTWRVKRTTSTQFGLFNVSNHAHTGVSIDGSRITCQNSGLPDRATIPGGDDNRYQFTMTPMRNETLPEFIYVRWDGMRPKPSFWKFWRDRYVAVAVEQSIERPTYQ
ncbi:hypothetical protein AB0M12_37790 [Nocardia vinacea]|uniref:hypothetical protein n=1 Tax=Nocardia vinacea TaxID=96468 RepID=UPI00344A7D83